MQEKIVAPMGVYAGILNKTGKLLLYRRTVTTSIVEGISFRGNWELPGRAVLQNETASYGYNYLVATLQEAVLDRAGMRIWPAQMPAFYPVFLGSGKVFDLAMVTVIREPRPVFALTEGREVMWVDPAELNEQARIFKPADEKKGVSGVGLVSGVGKRMHCMALMALSQGPNAEYAFAAREQLLQIQRSWPEPPY